MKRNMLVLTRHHKLRKLKFPVLQSNKAKPLLIGRPHGLDHRPHRPVLKHPLNRRTCHTPPVYRSVQISIEFLVAVNLTVYPPIFQIVQSLTVPLGTPMVGCPVDSRI